MIPAVVDVEAASDKDYRNQGQRLFASLQVPAHLGLIITNLFDIEELCS